LNLRQEEKRVKTSSKQHRKPYVSLDAQSTEHTSQKVRPHTREHERYNRQTFSGSTILEKKSGSVGDHYG